MPDNAKYFDWYTYQEDIDFLCPYCGGNERIKSELWLKDILQDKSGKTQLNTLYKKYLNGCIADNTEPQDFHTWLEEAYGNEELNDVGDPTCQKCEGGYTDPIYGYVYSIQADVTDENRRIALDCGLFLFEHPGDGGTYICPMGCGMDLTPNILLAHLKLTGNIQYDRALEFKQDYKANLSESEHAEIAIACRETIHCEFQTVEQKLKALDLFIDNGELVEKQCGGDEILLEAAQVEEEETEREEKRDILLDKAEDTPCEYVCKHCSRTIDYVLYTEHGKLPLLQFATLAPGELLFFCPVCNNELTHSELREAGVLP